MCSNYNALQVKAEWRNWHGLTALTAFTWGKGLDVWRVLQTYNRRSSYGLSPSDMPEAFIQSFTYRLPFGASGKWAPKEKLAREIVGGWQVNGIFTARAGYPVGILSAIDESGSFRA